MRNSFEEIGLVKEKKAAPCTLLYRDGKIQFLSVNKKYAAINKKGQSQVFFSFEEALSFLSKSI